MPSKSKAQQRFFGMVDAYKKGEMKNASSKIKKAADGMSMSDVKDFAETKHNGLPEKVEEQTIIRLTESDLHRIVKESVNRILVNEGIFDFFRKKKEPEITKKEDEVPKDHIYSVKELQWLYDNQRELNDFQRKVLNAAMWVRARMANYHGYTKEWPNIFLKNGETYYYRNNGELRKTGT